MSRCQHQWQPTSTIPVCALCGRVPNASPSQVETWLGCRRKHSYSRVRPRERENSAAAYGERCHTIAEAWLRDHVTPDLTTPEGRTVYAGIDFLPVPRTPGLVIEHRATPTLLGVPWDMRLDYMFGYEPGRCIVIGDHKTTGSISDHAKAAELLATTDPQGIAYSHWAAEEFQVPIVIGQWTYYQRDARRKARPVVFTITREQARERFTAMHESAVMPMVSSRVNAPELMPRDGLSNGHCSAYGGCPYQTECHAGITPAEHAASALHQLRRHMTPTVPPSLMAALTTSTIPGVPPLPVAPAAAPAPLPPPAAPALTPELEQWVQTGKAQGHDEAALRKQAAEFLAAQPPAPAPTPAPVEASAPTRMRGRPAKTVALQVLMACAQGGCSIELTEQYLELAKECA